MTDEQTALRQPQTIVMITCLCGTIQQQLPLNTSLPARSTICHCTTCRWTTGTLFQSVLPIEGSPKLVETLSRYDPSQTTSRYFCQTCGTHLFRKNHQLDSWYVASGVVDGTPTSEQVSCRLQQITDHQFVNETVDGGLALCLKDSSDASAPILMHNTDIECDTRGERDIAVHSEKRLHAACHCGGVEFFLSRPSEESGACSSPWPDLLRPYHSCDPSNPDDEKWWLRGSTKYLAGTCACRTCRLGNSSPITCWAFVPKANLTKDDGSAMTFDFGTLRTYQSSQGRRRDFCSKCGASVFLRIDERPELLDVAFGIFRAAEGSRAERWFDWCTSRVSFIEDAFDHELAALCESGLHQLNRGGKQHYSTFDETMTR